MKVLKFGGTSVGSAQRMKNVGSIILDGDPKIVVLSAMSGTTNTLVEIAGYLHTNNPTGASETIGTMEQKYRTVLSELFATDEYRKKTDEILKSIFATLRNLTKKTIGPVEEKEILAQGELLSTNMMHHYLLENGVKSVLLPALDYMRIDQNREPDLGAIKENLSILLQQNPVADIYLTQGFICRNDKNEIDNLERGGSDYSASLIGAVVEATEIQIWTDIDGMHNNDPRMVDNTAPVRHLHFEEAAELAYFGAKILHPTCILPAKLNNIPVRLLNTLQPDAQGTTISNEAEQGKIKAIAAKDGITAIKIKSGRMLLAYGFLRKVFEIFEKYQTPIDMITTSEVGVSVSIDNKSKLPEIVAELKKISTITVDENMVIICVVGDMQWDNVGFEARAVNALKDIPVRMISYGGSNYNISLLVKAEDKKRALQSLSEYLFK